ncbi:hypothetical protein M0L20_12050 [Spirosoma sp. RP8]|uniref:Uncharacterized protein n=1 Tax=Spirosoma liriopis TaxID=2937440 RepID=A0ABT0HKA1_9BACT|nr:hypothetical protein [Spirosoma liriopis]MCK8492589.1 hypothetical protein [Spirosoma liriopis]
MNYLFICFLVALSEVARAQAVTDPTVDLRLNNLNNPSTGPLIFKVDARYEGQHGSPYFLPGWSNGQVSLRDGRQYKDVPLKFDAYRQALLLLRPKSGNDSIIIDRQTVNRFLLTTPNGQPYLFSRYPSAKVTDDDVKDGYFLILYEGKTALLKRIAKTFKPADYKGGYSADIRYDSYGDAFSYYLLKPDQTLTKIKLSKKAFLDAMSDKESGLKAFIDQQKLSFKSEEDAITLVKQYDSL